ncbi:MAG: ribosome biogenesis GTP-binding protein YihA/YsxC [Pseudomonadota bacterium]
MFAGRWEYLRSCHALSQLPDQGPREVAFAGRSNVGKSSLINALAGQKGLAKASNTPGRTRALNLFAREDGATGPVITDMPGYGYAKAPKTEVAAWTKLVFDYLRGRAVLARVFVLIDARHGLKAVDDEALKVLDTAAVSYQAVLTKADKISASAQAKVLAEVGDGLRRRPAAHPDVRLTSADTGLGLAELRADIAELVTT